MEKSSPMNIKICNATQDKWPIIADMVKENIGVINRTGVAHGVGVRRGGVYAYVYITDSGKTVVAYVDDAKP